MYMHPVLPDCMSLNRLCGRSCYQLLFPKAWYWLKKGQMYLIYVTVDQIIGLIQVVNSKYFTFNWKSFLEEKVESRQSCSGIQLP